MKSTFGASGLAGSSDAAAPGAGCFSASASGDLDARGSGVAATLRSFVVAGSTSCFWFGTLAGVSIGPCPPAATAAAAG